MADDGVTDEELREKLLALGQKPGPIVDTTRKLWLKKLATLQANAKKASKTKVPSRKLIGFSSDESEPETKKAVPKTGRAPRGRGRGTARSRAKNSQNDIDNDDMDDEPKASGSHSVATARPSIRSRSSASVNNFGNNSKNAGRLGREASNDNTPNRADTSLAATNWRVPAQQKITRYSSSWSKPPVGLNNSQNNDFDSSDSEEEEDSLGPELHSMAVNTSPSLDISLPDVPTHIVGSPRSRLGGDDSLLSDDNTPKASSRRSTRIVRPRSDRNSLLSNNKKQDDLSSNRPTPSDARQGLRPSKSKSKTNSVKDAAPPRPSSEEENFVQHGFKVKEDPRVYKYSQYCSVLIVLVVLIFFLVLGGLYLKVRHVDKPKVCDIDGNKDECKDHFKECNSKLWEYLSQLAGEVECGYVTRQDGKKVKVDEAKKAADCVGFSGDSLKQVFENPDWKILAYDKLQKKTSKLLDVAYLESEMIQMPWMCRLKRAYDRFIFIMYMAIGGVALLFVTYSIIKYRRRRQEEANKRVFNMVEKIIDTIKQHNDAFEQNKELLPYVAILHVRDMLIPIKERKTMQKVWEEAVRFLEGNESRVRVETQIISGEEFIVWRWLQGLPNGGKSKVWQGQAFGEHSNTGMNKIPYSPSQCLKVRNMFDADIEYGSDWHVFIQDAVLEKCAATCSDAVYHIAVDKNSTEGCLYIKCSCPEAAGKVYAALHGWWFDGNLVTVKYIRLERYYERFPYAQAAMLPMRPSNDEMKSMAHAFHKSALERS